MKPPAISAVRAIARCTVLEARRGKLPWVLTALAAAALGVSGFASQLALTEADLLHTSLLAALLRLVCVGCIAVFTVTSALRDAQARGLHLLMAMALPRGAYIAGKFSGLALLSAAMAATCGVLLQAAASPQLATLWTAWWSLSLLCELWLAAGFSLLCALALAHPLPALAATGAFYVLARAAGAMQLAAQQSLRPHDPLQQWLSPGFDAIAALLPRLDTFTRASWLVYGDGSWSTVAVIAGQTALYLVLLGAAALFDLHRKEL